MGKAQRQFEKRESLISHCAKVRNRKEVFLRVPTRKRQIFRILHALPGKKEDAKAFLQDLMEKEKESVHLWAQLWRQNALGNLDEAFRNLSKMRETHDWPILMKYFSEFKELRSDPRCLEFRKSVGLES